jgi:hypothetical protein
MPTDASFNLGGRDGQGRPGSLFEEITIFWKNPHFPPSHKPKTNVAEFQVSEFGSPPPLFSTLNVH